MKVIIPMAGVGSRLRPHTHTMPKSLVPIAGRPIMAHILDRLVEAGLRDFVFVIGYLGSKIRDYVEEHYPELNIQYVVQEHTLGLGHAISLCKDQVREEEEVLILLGDTLVGLDLEPFFRSKYSVLGVRKTEQPSQFGIAEVDGRSGFISRLIEKPAIPKSNLALVGIYKIKQPKLLMEALEHIIANNITTQGEYHLTDALEYMVERGAQMKTLQVKTWFDCGRKSTLLDANAILLDRLHKEGKLPQDPSHQNTIIIPPVSIGEGCQISNSLVGPHVAIDAGTTMTYSVVQNSIVGNNSTLDRIVLVDSLIGANSSLRGPCQSLNIGDNTEIDFS